MSHLWIESAELVKVRHLLWGALGRWAEDEERRLTRRQTMDAGQRHSDLPTHATQ